VSEGKTQQEPSMEEILASIRRIISEDGKPEADAPPKAKAAVPPMPVKADVLELTEVVEEDGSVVSLANNGAEPEPEPEAVEAAAPAAEPQAMSDDRQPEVPPMRPAPPRPAAAAPTQEPESLISAATATAAAGALAGLSNAATRTSVGPVLGNSGRTVEDLVIEALRPMLREWLDQNLPKLTERLVKREIARIARRAEEE